MTESEIENSIIDYIAEDKQKGLSLLVSLLVGLVEHEANIAGKDPSKRIIIDGGLNRNVIIDSVKDVIPPNKTARPNEQE